jgi:transposase
VYDHKFPNDLEAILAVLRPLRSRICGIAVESTYNWYWLVDGLRANNFQDIKLANPARMQENIGLKHANDKTDSRFIARQLAMGTLPEGYIYPEETRGVRDLMRRRIRLVQTRTKEWLSLECLVARHTGKQMSIAELQSCEIATILKGQPQALAMSRTGFRLIAFLEKEIRAMETEVLAGLPDLDAYKLLMTIPGIGPILARTILLETGPIERFRHAANYASYCRAVKAEHSSNGKKKGEGNAKCGNKYLGWAFVEAANHAVRYSPEMRAWFQRKQARRGKRVIAIKALACKLSKACFFMLRDKTEFNVKRLVG